MTILNSLNEIFKRRDNVHMQTHKHTWWPLPLDFIYMYGFQFLTYTLTHSHTHICFMVTFGCTNLQLIFQFCSHLLDLITFADIFIAGSSLSIFTAKTYTGERITVSRYSCCRRGNVCGCNKLLVCSSSSSSILTMRSTCVWQIFKWTTEQLLG